MGGLRIHARASGNPAPKGRIAVVLVHGLVVSSRYMVPIAERLAPYNRVFAPDLPGFGRSERPLQALDVAGLSDALSNWMGEVGLERAALVGNSMGCQVIADLAVRYPARVARAVLQGPTMDPKGRSVSRQVGSCSTCPVSPSPSSPSSYSTISPQAHDRHGTPSGTP